MAFFDCGGNVRRGEEKLGGCEYMSVYILFPLTCQTQTGGFYPTLGVELILHIALSLFSPSRSLLSFSLGRDNHNIPKRGIALWSLPLLF